METLGAELGVLGDEASVIQEVRGLAEEVASLRRENHTLQNNFDELKSHHGNIQTAYDSLASQYQHLQADRTAMEAHYQQQIEGWRLELDSKHRQFEEARAQIMQPRELEKLRMQLVEELEAPTREKLQAYERDAEESVDKYAQAMRDLETLRTQHDIDLARVLKEAEYQKMDHAQEISMLRKESTIGEEDVRVKSRQIEALQDEVRDHLQVRATNAALSADNDAQRQMRAEAVVAAEKAEAALRSRVMVMDKLERRVGGMQAEVEECNADIARAHVKLEQAETLAMETNRRLEDEQFKRRADVKRAHAEAAKERTELEAEFAIEREEAEEKERTILARLATHDSSIQRIQDDCDARINAADGTARAARRAAEDSVATAEGKLDAAMVDLASNKSEALKAAGETKGLRAALAVLKREYEHEVPALRDDLAQFKKDLGNEQLRLSDAKQTMEVERAERVQVGATMVERDREVRRLTAACETQDLHQARDIAALRKAWREEKTTLIMRAKEIAAASEERHRESMRKAKRKLEVQTRKIAALSMDKVALLEEAGGAVFVTRPEEGVGEVNMLQSVFDRELVALKDRQTSYGKSITSL